MQRLKIENFRKKAFSGAAPQLVLKKSVVPIVFPSLLSSIIQRHASSPRQRTCSSSSAETACYRHRYCRSYQKVLLLPE